MAMIVAALAIGFFGSGFGSVAFADHLDTVDALVEQADALIEYSDELIEADDQTVEAVDSAIESVDLIVEDAIAAFDAGEDTLCEALMEHADTVIEALVSGDSYVDVTDPDNPVVIIVDPVVGILGGADLLVEAVDALVEDALAKLGEALDIFPPGGTGVEARAFRALEDAYDAADFADSAVEDADDAVEAAIEDIVYADFLIEEAKGCVDEDLLDDADEAVEDADETVEDADAAVEDADAAIEFADREIEHADRLIEAANHH